MRGLDNAEMLLTIAFLACCFSRVRLRSRAAIGGQLRSSGCMPATSVRVAQTSTRFASAPTEVSAVAMARRHPHVDGMSNAPQIAEVAALVGDPARANILCELLGGR